MSKPDLSWWDPYSDQPYVLPAYRKPRGEWPKLREYLIIAATALAVAPRLAWACWRLRPLVRRREIDDFVALSVSPHDDYEDEIVEMVADLGVRELLLRIPVWDLKRLHRYRRFAQRFPEQRFLINVLQDRESVLRPERWRVALREVFAAFSPFASHFQIGNAINRSKWGCVHSGEYLRLLEIAEQVRVQFPAVKLVGSSVIDFEPLVTLRTLRNRHHYYLDAVGSLLYVNRRGSPYSRQYGIFDLQNKLRLIYAMVTLGNHNERRLWVTETNWPLLNTRPYTPNSGHPRSTVDEDTQARYLKLYYQIAYRTGWVDRVYWWQLINPGYGLVDHRGGSLRKMPSYYAFKELMEGALYRDPQVDQAIR